jgi:starch phosphorylase
MAGTIAYFTMEVALEDAVPTYSGGLGVLAGDHLRAAADLGLPLVAVTLVYHQGYLRQSLDAQGGQHDEPVEWSASKVLGAVAAEVTVVVNGRPVAVTAWRYDITGVSGAVVPVYFLDTRTAANDPRDRSITDRLYGGEQSERLRQEAVLGLAGPALLTALGYDVATYHMNEGHSALLTLALSRAALARAGRVGDPAFTAAERADVRARCVFTTHTPVPAGHDRFPRALVDDVLGKGALDELESLGGMEDGQLNMTRLGMGSSRFVNAVSVRHRQVSAAMFPGVEIAAITNGVHVATWAGPSVQRLFDERLPGWRSDNAALRDAVTIEPSEIRRAHDEAKRVLSAEVHQRTGVTLDPQVFTVGVARRATAYKRSHLLLADPERLRAVVERSGPLQVLYGGKAHPRDEEGKDVIRTVTAAARGLEGAVTVVYIPDYSLTLAGHLCAGSDLWLNTPEPPHEASGTSGMKAALNGVPSLSILDGWWLEGHVEGVTGWAIGDDDLARERSDAADAQALLDTLERTVLPLYYGDPDGFAEVRRAAIALNGSWFTTERMVRDYAHRAYGIRAAF